jgi:hypothetical protein
MANDVIQTTFDKEKYQELQECYDLAKFQNKEQFVFYGEVLLVSYAKYLLEYLKPLVK